MTSPPGNIPERQTRTEQLTENDRCRLLSASHRRTVLAVLEERSLPVDLEELATAIAARETDAPTDHAVDRATILLYHVHLPMMAELGVIDYDLDSKQIK